MDEHCVGTKVTSAVPEAGGVPAAICGPGNRAGGKFNKKGGEIDKEMG